MKPNLFLVGHPKSGTTAMHAFLSEHPQVFMSQPKEPWFFCTDFHHESDTFHSRRLFFPYRELQEYLQLFSGAKNVTVVGEASANYLGSASAAANIRALNPEARILIMLREPVAFLESLHKEYFRNAMEDQASLADAVALESERQKGEAIPPRVPCPSWVCYSRWIRYSEQIRRYLEQFDREQVMIIVSEEFRNDNAGVYRQVLDFLGVENTFQARFRAINSLGRVRISRMGQVFFSPRFRRLAHRALPYSLYSLGITLTRSLFWIKDSTIPQASEALRARLREQFAPEVERTSELLDQLRRPASGREGFRHSTRSAHLEPSTSLDMRQGHEAGASLAMDLADLWGYS